MRANFVKKFLVLGEKNNPISFKSAENAFSKCTFVVIEINILLQQTSVCCFVCIIILCNLVKSQPCVQQCTVLHTFFSIHVV